MFQNDIYWKYNATLGSYAIDRLYIYPLVEITDNPNELKLSFVCKGDTEAMVEEGSPSKVYFILAQVVSSFILTSQVIDTVNDDLATQFEGTTTDTVNTAMNETAIRKIHLPMDTIGEYARLWMQ
ncbi:hypothetical protein QTN25_000064 [Entamoeba marina]